MCVFNIKASTYVKGLNKRAWIYEKNIKKYLKELSHEMDLAFDDMYG